MQFYKNLSLKLNHISLETKKCITKYVSKIESTENFDENSVPNLIKHIRGHISNRGKDYFLGWYGVIYFSDDTEIILTEKDLIKLMNKFNLRYTCTSD